MQSRSRVRAELHIRSGKKQSRRRGKKEERRSKGDSRKERAINYSSIHCHNIHCLFTAVYCCVLPFSGVHRIIKTVEHLNYLIQTDIDYLFRSLIGQLSATSPLIGSKLEWVSVLLKPTSLEMRSHIIFMNWNMIKQGQSLCIYSLGLPVVLPSARVLTVETESITSRTSRTKYSIQEQSNGSIQDKTPFGKIS